MLFFSISDEGYSRGVSCALNLYSTFLKLILVHMLAKDYRYRLNYRISVSKKNILGNNVCRGTLSMPYTCHQSVSKHFEKLDRTVKYFSRILSI